MSSILIYRQHEQDALRALGFHWMEKDKEWFSDKRCYGRGNNAVFLQNDYDNLSGKEIFVFVYRQTREEDGEYKESYEYFDTIEGLEAYLK